MLQRSLVFPLLVLRFLALLLLIRRSLVSLLLIFRFLVLRFTVSGVIGYPMVSGITASGSGISVSGFAGVGTAVSSIAGVTVYNVSGRLWLLITHTYMATNIVMAVGTITVAVMVTECHH